MSEDKLLSALGRVAAEQAAERERFEALDAQDAAPSSTSDEDAQLARRLFAKASDASIDRTTARVMADLAKGKARPALVVPMRLRALRWAGFAAVPLAAAAAIALFVARPQGNLPSYTLSVTGGVREERGAEARTPLEAVAVAPRTQIVLLARPDARASGGVHAATFLLRQGAAVLVPSASEASEKGALRVTVLGDDLTKAAGASGLYDLVLIVGRSAEVDPRALVSGDASNQVNHGDWVRFTVPVRVADSNR